VLLIVCFDSAYAVKGCGIIKPELNETTKMPVDFKQKPIERFFSEIPTPPRRGKI
jgi:hypothetical protein